MKISHIKRILLFELPCNFLISLASLTVVTCQAAASDFTELYNYEKDPDNELLKYANGSRTCIISIPLLICPYHQASQSAKTYFVHPELRTP